LGCTAFHVNVAKCMWAILPGPLKQDAKNTHLHHGQTEKSPVAEHLLNTGYEIRFERTHRLNRKTKYMDQIVKEGIEIQLHAANANKGTGFMLSLTWQPVASLLKCCPQPGIDSPGHMQQHFDSSH